MNNVSRVLLPVLSALSLSGWAAPQILWSVGNPDRSGKEFALKGHYDQFSRKYPGAFQYTVGQTPAGEWPFIHPGPEDRWAGSTTHPLTIVFDLPAVPQGECVLAVDLVGSHGLPVELETSLNGTPARVTFPSGGGDAALGDENAGTAKPYRLPFHPSLLRQGRNELTLAVTSGAWLLYDAIRLENTPGKAIRRLYPAGLENTPFFSRGADGLRQNLILTVGNTGPALPVTAVTRCGDAVLTEALTLRHGESRLDLPVPCVNEPTSVTVTLSSPEEEARAEGTVTPQRRWKVYVAPSIHTDIGYTDTQEAVFKRHNKNLDDVIDMCRANPLFKWNIEVAWEMQNYMADRPETATRTLLRLMEENRVGLHAGYLNELTALMSDEAMNRYAYYAAELRRKYGMDTSAAILTDVPSATWSLPSTLAASGVRFFAQGSNQTRAPILRNSGIRDPFYWEGPDGGRVLMWFANLYGQSTWLARTEKLTDLQRHVTDFLRPYEKDYPYDAVYVYGAFLDNEPVDKRYGALLREWNEKWVYPKVILSTGSEFGDYLEAAYRDRIPVKRCDFGHYWEDGAGSTAQETIQHMRSQRRITAAETLWSLARLAGEKTEYPAARVRKAWEDLLFYAEHTWGAAQSISDPDGPMTRKQWEGKAKYAHDADRDTGKLLEEGLQAYLRTVPARAGEIVVVNPFSWKRSGLAQLPETSLPGTEVVDENGRAIPSQEIDGRITFYAFEVPAFGSRTYRTRPGTPAPAASSPASGFASLTNPHYEIRADNTRGITSIVDSATGQELVDVSSPYGFGQVVYAAGGEDTTLVMDNATSRPEVRLSTPEAAPDGLNAPPGTLLLTPARVTKVETRMTGPICSEVVLYSAAPSLPDIRTHVRLYHPEKRIGIDVRMTSKTEIRRKEAVYVAFPLAVKDPRFRLGLTNAVAKPDTDFARGACHEWYSVQDFVACRDAAGKGAEVVWASLDTPLITLSEVNGGRWSPTPELTTGTLFSYAMNNYWFTNYKAGQGGDFQFRYELTSGRPEEFGNESCVRFGRHVSLPLLAAVSDGGGGETAGQRRPVLGVSGAGIVGTTLKPAEDGRGVIVRMRNTAENPTTAALQLAGELGQKRVERLNLVEEEPETVPVANGTAELALKGQQTATVRVGW